MKFQFFLPAVVAFSLVACGGNGGHKISVRKNQKGSAQSDQWSLDSRLVAKDEKGKIACLQLPRLMELVEALGDKLVVVHPLDLSFGRYVFDKGSDRSHYEPLAEDLTMQRTAYFLKGPNKEDLLEVGPGKVIRESAQVGAALNIVRQSGCDSVSFADGSKFSIVNQGTATGLTLISEGGRETRTYFVGSGQGRKVVVTVTRQESRIPECGTGVTERLVRRSYLIAPDTEVESVSTGQSLADLLSQSVYEMRAANTKKSDKVSATRRRVSFATWEYLKKLVDSNQGKLKDFSCKTK